MKKTSKDPYLSSLAFSIPIETYKILKLNLIICFEFYFKLSTILPQAKPSPYGLTALLIVS